MVSSSAEATIPSQKRWRMWPARGCLLLSELQHLVQPEEGQIRRWLRKQGSQKVGSHENLTKSLLDHCEPQDCAKRSCPGVVRGAAIAMQVCTNWIFRFYEMTRSCTDVLVENPEPPHVVQNVSSSTSRMLGLKPTPPEWLSVSESSADEEGMSKTVKLQDDELYVPDSVVCLSAASPCAADRLFFANVSGKHEEPAHKSLLYPVHGQHQIEKELICIHTSGNSGWMAFSPQKNCWIDLPYVFVDSCFNFADKEALAAGNHLLWIGKNVFDCVCYKYDHVLKSWAQGPCMLTPRYLFASATCGQHAYVAGGFTMGGMVLNVLNSVERYDCTNGSWELLAPMKTPRQKCSAFFMDGKFYVIGGNTKNHEQLTCGEEYDPVRNVWRTIENMYAAPDSLLSYERPPPLVAVAGNELYMIDAANNILKIYEKATNAWRALGMLPLRVGILNGWGLAFKGLGDHLFLIGEQRCSLDSAKGISVFACKPQPVEALEWLLINSAYTGAGSFLFNCVVMTFQIDP